MLNSDKRSTLSDDLAIGSGRHDWSGNMEIAGIAGFEHTKPQHNRNSGPLWEFL